MCPAKCTVTMDKLKTNNKEKRKAILLKKKLKK